MLSFTLYWCFIPYLTLLLLLLLLQSAGSCRAGQLLTPSEPWWHGGVCGGRGGNSSEGQGGKGVEGEGWAKAVGAKGGEGEGWGVDWWWGMTCGG
jgi:hypothetical protein